MATERQRAANQKNVLRSRGPSSRAGIARSARNAYRHGLAAKPSAAALQQIEELAREIAGNSAGLLQRQSAREAAHAAIDLARVREIKIAIFDRALAAERHKPAPLIDSAIETKPKAERLPRCHSTATDSGADRHVPAQIAAALRRAMPDLIKLDRYEARALARRNRAIRALMRYDDF